MVDIHCHILPAVDDGAWDLDASVNMARIAEACGVKTIIATPHFKGTMASLKELPQIMHQFRVLRQAIKEASLELELIPGAEVLCLPQTIELARRDFLPTLGDSRYVLTEFYFDASSLYMDATLEELRRLGYSPVLAHPERYGAVQREPELVQRWFEQGIVIQVNKGSVLGAFGQRAEDAAMRLLHRGVVHIIASDAHGPEARTPNLEPVRRWCLNHLGQEYTQILLEDNPSRITAGESMHGTSRRNQAF